MQTFSELPLSAPVLRAIKEAGFETPSPIQQQALPILLGEPTDFLGLAGTGTGKTAAFALPLLEKIDPKVKGVQALVLCPTRELAMQVAGQIDLLGKYKGVKTVTVYGGASYNDQIRGLRQGASVVVGTPGRVIDHITRKSLILDNVQVLVLDEADEMFSMGFKDELDTILGAVPQDQSNTWLFSATMSREVRRIAETNLRSPQTVQVNRTEMLSSGVEQYFYRSQEFEKKDMICTLIEAADNFYGLIFCQTKALVADLTVHLIDRGYKVDCLHGDKDQTSRERTMQAFRDRKLQVLVCTDVAARGLDVKDITHVVNYSLPREMESYVHRIGRTARSGKTGIVMNLVTMSHRHLISRIEQHTKVQMKEGFVPSGREIGAKKVSKLLTQFEDQPFHARVLEVMGEDWKAKLATMTTEEVASHFIAMMMPDVFSGGDSRKTKKAARDVGTTPRELPPVNSHKITVPTRSPMRNSSPYSSPMSAPSVSMSAPVSKPRSQPVFEAPEMSSEVSDVESVEMVSAPQASPRVSKPKISKPAASQADVEFDGPSLIDDAEEVDASSYLDQPTVFGVTPDPITTPTRGKREFAPRASSSRPARTSSRPRTEYGSGSDFRPRAEARSRMESRPRTESRGVPSFQQRGERPAFQQRSERPAFEERPTSPLRFSKNGAPPVRTNRAPAGEMNLSKAPRHLPGPAHSARHGGELPELNRRARRAAKFGNPIA
ncbi:MAG: DEAD/DEAH box helicase [Bdellovibrionota bacterium]